MRGCKDENIGEKRGFYELDYLGWCVLLFALFLVLSYGVFLKKDIQFRS